MPRFGDFIVQQNKRFLLFFAQQKISKRCPWKTEFLHTLFLETKRKLTKTIAQQRFSGQNKSVSQKLA